MLGWAGLRQTHCWIRQHWVLLSPVHQGSTAAGAGRGWEGQPCLFLCLETQGQPLSSPPVQLRLGQTIARLLPVPLWQQVVAWAACCQSTWATSEARFSACFDQARSLWCWRGSCSSPYRWREVGCRHQLPAPERCSEGLGPPAAPWPWCPGSPTEDSGCGVSRGATWSKSQELFALATLQFCTNTVFQICTLGRDLALSLPLMAVGGGTVPGVLPLATHFWQGSDGLCIFA